MNIVNFGRWLAEAVIAPDKQGYECIIVVVKVTFDIGPDGALALSAHQVSCIHADQYFGIPGKSSVKYEHDFAPIKHHCDLIVNGSAYTSNDSATETIISLQYQDRVKRVKVIGDRIWEKKVFSGYRPSLPRPFSQMLLTWEKAFGGADDIDKDASKHVFELRNLLGVGLRTQMLAGSDKPPLLPNVEDPANLITSPGDRPAPQGFGFIGRGWLPRLSYGGTYDQRWQAERFPFLPDDFNELYYQGAPVNQIVPYPLGGEQIVLLNWTPDGLLRFQLPKLSIPITVRFRELEQEMLPNLDTVIIEPDERRLILTFRASTRCRGKPTDIEAIRVGHPTPAWQKARASGKAFVDWKKFKPPRLFDERSSAPAEAEYDDADTAEPRVVRGDEVA